MYLLPPCCYGKAFLAAALILPGRHPQPGGKLSALPEHLLGGPDLPNTRLCLREGLCLREKKSAPPGGRRRCASTAIPAWSTPPENGYSTLAVPSLAVRR